jgi:hypothetical protein
MTLDLLKVHLQTYLSVPINKKCQIFSGDTLVAKPTSVVLESQNKLTLKFIKIFQGKDCYKVSSYRNMKHAVYAQLTSSVCVTVFKIN